MPPKETAAAVENARLVQLERSINQHEEGLDRLNQQCSYLREGFGRLEEKQTREFSQMTAAFEQMGEIFQALMSKVEAFSVQPLAPTPGRLNPGATSLLGSNPGQEQIKLPPDRGYQAPTFGPKIPRVDFPQFNGTKVCNWFQKSQRFFLLHIMEDRLKILYASLKFSDAAETFFQTDPMRFAELSWTNFCVLLQESFSEELSDNVIGEFKLLSQKSSVLDYQQSFEHLRPLVHLQNPGLTEKYFVDSCLAGLKEEIRHSVQMFYPSTVQSVFALASLQEANLSSRSNSRGTRVYSNVKYNSNYTPSVNSNLFSKHDSMSGNPEGTTVKSVSHHLQSRS